MTVAPVDGYPSDPVVNLYATPLVKPVPPSVRISVKPVGHVKVSPPPSDVKNSKINLPATLLPSGRLIVTLVASTVALPPFTARTVGNAMKKTYETTTSRAPAAN